MGSLLVLLYIMSQDPHTGSTDVWQLNRIVVWNDFCTYMWSHTTGDYSCVGEGLEAQKKKVEKDESQRATIQPKL